MNWIIFRALRNFNWSYTEFPDNASNSSLIAGNIYRREVGDLSDLDKLIAGGYINLISPVTTDRRVQDLGNITGVTTLDVSLGNIVTATVTGETTWVISNPNSAGQSSTVMVILTNGGAFTQHYPPAVKWPSSTPPVLTAAGTDILVFTTIDGGTVWDGMLSGANFS